MDRGYDVAVIGAGIVGVSTALHLQMRGKKVLLIDRRAPGQETSFGNAGIIGNGYVLPFAFPSLKYVPGILLGRNPSARIHYSSIPRYLPWLIRFYFKSQTREQLKTSKTLWPLIAKAAEEHLQLAKNTDAERHIHSTGRVALYRTEEGFSEGDLDRKIAQELGVPFDVFDAHAFHEIEPDLKPLYKKAVRWSSSPRVDNPGALIKAYAERFTAEGGIFLETDARKLTPAKDSWCIETLLGDLKADQVVICTGPWANEMVQSLGYHFPLAIKRGYHQHYPSLAGAKLAHAIFDVDGGYGLSPMESGYRLCTGIEFAELDAPPTPVQIAQVLPKARQLFPLGDAIEPRAWCGNRPCFTDSLPVTSAASRHQGLWFNFGHGHIGLTTGPSTGRLLAEMIDGASPFCDPEAYSARRFGC